MQVVSFEVTGVDAVTGVALVQYKVAQYRMICGEPCQNDGLCVMKGTVNKQALYKHTHTHTHKQIPVNIFYTSAVLPYVG